MKLTDPIRLPKGIADRFEALLGDVAAPTPPAVAVEVAPDYLAVARRGAAGIAPARLAPGEIAPSATRPNISEPEAVAARLRTLLESVAAQAQPVMLLVPDLTARLALLDFDVLPSRRDELEALARLRLRKTLPFAEEQAVFSCQALSSTRLLVAYADRTRLAEYEDCLERAGGSAAVVLPSGLAACAALPVLDHRTLLLRAQPGSLTTAFCWHGRLEFFRALAVAGEPTLDDVFPSVAFFRDRVESADESSTADPQSDPPVLLAAGLAAALEARLRDEAPWAEVRSADRADELAVTGALRAPGKGGRA